MARPKIEVPLSERVCIRGHVGQYRQRGNSKACHECSKIAVSRFRERAGVPHSPVPLEERVCSHGHVGKYVIGQRGHARCAECSKIASKAHNDRVRDTTSEELTIARLTKRREKLTAELAELMLRIAFEESIIQQRQESR
jgi:hypothetical protein